jgi:CheY-like chemotaxis protein/anti-sigma regulatory factor (Ser/Thr protein kinase)
LELDENLPSRLIGDELRIRQVLNNLLSNAIKYTDEGTVKMSVSFSDGFLHFIVTDTGQGMKPEDLQKLFSDYSRFNMEANRTTEGTGLGLNIAKSFVEMMDGEISVESEFGKGSTFSVKIWQESVDAPPIGASLAKQLCSFSFTAKRENLQITREPMPYGNVLVVDDVETNLYVASGLLLQYKLGVETAYSGFDALKKINNGKKYDIIFMDHMMPKMDGIETTQKIRALGYSGTIIALTANALTGNDEMFMQHGFDGFIPKPINLVLLNKTLNKFIRDKYQEEAKKYKAETLTEEITAKPNETLLKAVRHDAEKAIVAIRDAVDAHDTKALAITAHGMKPGLAIIGEEEAAKMAAELESRPEPIAAEKLFEMLEEIIKKRAPRDEPPKEAAVEGDENFLHEQMEIIKAACEEYDDKTIFAALDALAEKSWNPEITEKLEKIRSLIYSDSDFEAAAEIL